MITWIVFGVYALAMIYLGFRSRHTEKGDDYWTAARDLSGWSAGLSLSAGFMSISWSCVYAIQVFYWYGLSGFFLMTIPWMLALGGIYFLATRYHGLPSFSQAEMVRVRFGPPTANLISLTQIIVFLIWGGAEIYVAANLLEPSLGVDKRWIMLLIALTIGIYSTWGGFSAVVQTDKFQYVFVASYLIAVSWMAWESASGQDIMAAKPAKALDVGFDPALWPMIAITAMAYLPGWLSEADLWLRVQAARDATEARKAGLIGLLNSFVFVGVVPAFIALTALNLYPPGDPEAVSVIGQEGERIISAIVRPFQNPWLEGFLGIGLLCASMSTIDTCTNIVSLNFSREIFQIKHLLGSKAINAMVVCTTLIVAVNVDSLWDIFYLSSGLLSTAVALPVLATLNKKIQTLPVFLSSLFGFAATVLFYFNGKYEWFNITLGTTVRSTGLEYIVLGMMGTAAGFLLGYSFPVGRRSYN